MNYHAKEICLQVDRGAFVPITVNSQVCKGGDDCPIAKGSEQDLKLSMLLSASFPKIKFNVRIDVLDSKAATLVCAQFVAQTV